MEPGTESVTPPQTIPVADWEAFEKEWTLSVAGGEVQNKPIDVGLKTIAARILFTRSGAVAAYIPLGAIYRKIQEPFEVTGFRPCDHEVKRLDVDLPDEFPLNEKWPVVFWLESQGYEVEKVDGDLFVQADTYINCRYFAVYHRTDVCYRKEWVNVEGIPVMDRDPARILTIPDKSLEENSENTTFGF